MDNDHQGFFFSLLKRRRRKRDCFRFFEATAVSACGACLLGSGPVGLPLDSQTSLERGGCGSSVKTLGEDASTFFTPDQQLLSGFKVAWMRLEVNHCTFWTPRAAAGGVRAATEDVKGVKFAGQTDRQTDTQTDRRPVFVSGRKTLLKKKKKKKKTTTTKNTRTGTRDT